MITGTAAGTAAATTTTTTIAAAAAAAAAAAITTTATTVASSANHKTPIAHIPGAYIEVEVQRRELVRQWQKVESYVSIEARRALRGRPRGKPEEETRLRTYRYFHHKLKTSQVF